MKEEALHLQILSYLKDSKEGTQLPKVFEEFLEHEQGILVQAGKSECRGAGCFQRVSAILFAIKRLQQDNQIILAHIDTKLPEHNQGGHNEYIEIGCTTSSSDGKITGDYQKFLEDYLLASIYVSEEACDYIKRGGTSRELQQTKQQTIVTWIALSTTLAASVASIFMTVFC